MAKRAVALLSGGLDSVLAARVVMDQGYEIAGLFFSSPFSKSYGSEERTAAAAVSRSLGIRLRVLDLGQPYIDLIRNPRHGYGKNINPCIDCKIHMLERARRVMDEIGAPFVITGEVLGQRPMSQRRDTLQIIERDAGLKGLILRPLSASLLPPTRAELDGLIDRQKLLGISGRGRTVQLRLAERFGIKGFSSPAGGCLLTDKNYAAKLRDLFAEKDSISPVDVQLLAVGRHFRLDRSTKIVLGRNDRENQFLMNYAPHGYHLFVPYDFPGPVALFSGRPDPEVKQAIGRLILTYSKKIPGSSQLIRFGTETFDPGAPLPICPPAIRKVGTEH